MEENETQEALLDIQQTAKALGCSVPTVHRYRRSGKLEGIQYTTYGKWHFAQSEINRFKNGARKGRVEKGEILS